MFDGTITGNYAQLQKYAKIGQAVEQRQMLNNHMQKVVPSIEREAVRKYAPIIADETRRQTVAEIAAALNQRQEPPSVSYRYGNGLSKLNTGEHYG